MDLNNQFANQELKTNNIMKKYDEYNIQPEPLTKREWILMACLVFLLLVGIPLLAALINWLFPIDMPQ